MLAVIVIMVVIVVRTATRHFSKRVRLVQYGCVFSSISSTTVCSRSTSAGMTLGSWLEFSDTFCGMPRRTFALDDRNTDRDRVILSF